MRSGSSIRAVGGNQNLYDPGGTASGVATVTAGDHPFPETFILNTDVTEPTLSVSRVGEERLRASTTATWTLNFSAHAIIDIRTTPSNFFSVTSVSDSDISITGAHPTYTLTAINLPSTGSDSDTTINLTLKSGSTLRRLNNNEILFDPANTASADASATIDDYVLTPNAAQRFIHNTDNTGPTITAFADVVRNDGESDGRIRASGNISWDVTFDQAVSNIGTNDFALIGATAGSITGVVPSPSTSAAANTHRVTANVRGTYNNDTNIHLALATNVTIDDTNANVNSFVRPTFITSGNQITNTTNQYILNTDTVAPVASTTRNNSRDERVYNNNNNDRDCQLGY